MHEHGRGRGEQNDYLYYEVPGQVPEPLEEQKQPRGESRQQLARNQRHLRCGTH